MQKQYNLIRLHKNKPQEREPGREGSTCLVNVIIPLSGKTGCQSCHPVSALIICNPHLLGQLDNCLWLLVAFTELSEENSLQIACKYAGQVFPSV